MCSSIIPLIFVSNKRCIKTLKILTFSRVNLNESNKNCSTPFIVTTFKRHTETVKYLIEYIHM